jgi:D-apionolactonase
MKEIVLQNDVQFEIAHKVAAGNFDALYETGRLRYIKYNSLEVLKMMYPALRAEDWTTVKGAISDEEINTDSDGFFITYKMLFDNGTIKYKAEFEITAKNNVIVFVMRGTALSDFKSKRIGLCVHHPIASCAGRRVVIDHPEERTSSYTFPELIAPVWPFTDIQAMKWNTGNVSVELNFKGDLFETEDQRNWTDDSYKTYSGPQYKTPMLDVKKDDTMQQTITLKVHEIKYRFPKIGYCRGKEQEALSDDQINLLKQIPFDHYRVEIDLSHNNWKDVLDKAREEVVALNTAIELVVNCKSASIEQLIGEIRDVNIDSILIISDSYKEVYPKIKNAFPSLPVGYGKRSWFADLNSDLPGDIEYEFTAFLVSPQVHQDDNRSIIENLGSQHTTVETLNNKTGSKPVHVSPVVFNSREDDARLHTSFAAWWTINAIYNFAAAGHISFYELTGTRGIVFNGTSPLFELFQAIKQFQPRYIFKNNKAEIVLENGDNNYLIIKSQL